MAERRDWKFEVARGWLVLWGFVLVGCVISQVGWSRALRVGGFMVFAASLIWAYVTVMGRLDDDG